MARRLPLGRPSPALIVACIALFVALGGLGYAAIKIPKNSVGTAQLKNGAVSAKKIAKNAVSGDKIADGSVTGAEVDESTLSQVPSAANAANAANAAKVGGLAPSTFARADRFYAGNGDPGAVPAAVLIAIPNALTFETDGTANTAFEVRLRNPTADVWEVSTEGNAGLTSVAAGSSVFVGAMASNNVATWMIRDASHTDRYALVECGYHPVPNARIECFARISPAL